MALMMASATFLVSWVRLMLGFLWAFSCMAPLSDEDAVFSGERTFALNEFDAMMMQRIALNLMIIFDEWPSFQVDRATWQSNYFPAMWMHELVSLLQIWYDFMSENYIDFVTQFGVECNGSGAFRSVYNPMLNFIFFFAISRNDKFISFECKRKNPILAPLWMPKEVGAVSDFFSPKNYSQMKWNSFISIKYRYGIECKGNAIVGFYLLFRVPICFDFGRWIWNAQ